MYEFPPDYCWSLKGLQEVIPTYSPTVFSEVWVQVTPTATGGGNTPTPGVQNPTPAPGGGSVEVVVSGAVTVVGGIITVVGETVTVVDGKSTTLRGRTSVVGGTTSTVGGTTITLAAPASGGGGLSGATLTAQGGPGGSGGPSIAVIIYMCGRLLAEWWVWQLWSASYGFSCSPMRGGEDGWKRKRWGEGWPLWRILRAKPTLAAA